jgi:hypothetical protein
VSQHPSIPASPLLSISTTLNPAHNSVNAPKLAFLIFATSYPIPEEPPPSRKTGLAWSNVPLRFKLKLEERGMSMMLPFCK